MSDKILLVGPSWVGDMVLAIALFRLLAQTRPGVILDVVAPGWSAPLLARVPEVRRAVPLNVGHGRLGVLSRWRLGRSLRGEGYDQAIILPRSLKSAVVPWLAEIPRRTGFLGEWRWGLLNDIRPLDQTALPRTVDRFCALGLPPGDSPPSSPPHPLLLASSAGAEAARLKLDLPAPPGPLAIFCPGAEYGPAKQWPEVHFAVAARELTVRGWTVWVMGSAKEVALGETIVRLAGLGREGGGAAKTGEGAVLSLCGRTSLGEAVDLLSLADAVVSNDSGLMHVAAALGRKVIALFGSSDPHHTPPMGPEIHILSAGLSCSPCFKRTCPEYDEPRCLWAILPEQVVEAVLREEDE
ncbi:MAG: lipopolysaccharide heptosyltransferase II [Magnetococcales bacterium]|nr:lipopolysaccharide heptosyltransferase II [Magnetococcales bacterium]